MIKQIKDNPKYYGLKRPEGKILLSSATMHGDEEKYVHEAFETGWVATEGENIIIVEKTIADYVGVKYAVGLCSGTAALHMAIKLAAEKIYGQCRPNEGALAGKKVFCSDVTFDASVNPVAYENGDAIFIDSEENTWNMDPKALQKAFEIYPEVKLIVLAHLYGTPGKVREIRQIADEHGALIVEDAAESLGARYMIKGQWKETGGIGDYNAISFNGNKIITGSSGGMFLTNSKEDADKVRKWSTQSREAAQWYQHEEIGYNYRMSNLIAGVIRGQIPYLDSHIERKRKIYEKYRVGLSELPIKMNPYDTINSLPNYWLSCLMIDEDAMTRQCRGEKDYLYLSEKGKSCPQEILDVLSAYGCEGRPIWKPMHMQPIYRNNAFITVDGNGRARSNAYIECEGIDVGKDIFNRGVCLPSDIKMTDKQQDFVIEIIKRCFK
ncbi:MAG: DegT/DnrJ/EryC1/StrS family aminotransferase [Butyrivibrio sp.]|nr:DegT/DnrJ/EryC1/StrS family aminotransferase [Butyrivibrio sp.]